VATTSWVLHRRHGSDDNYEPLRRRRIERIRDRVLDGAHLSAGMTLIDIGSGDGLIAFGALARLGPSLRVILTDVSGPLSAHPARLAVGRGVRECCESGAGSAERLEGIANTSADVSTTRAVFAFVADKGAAPREFARV
jgi:arsenite methyltransferase